MSHLHFQAKNYVRLFWLAVVMAGFTCASIIKINGSIEMNIRVYDPNYHFNEIDDIQLHLEIERNIQGVYMNCH